MKGIKFTIVWDGKTCDFVIYWRNTKACDSAWGVRIRDTSAGRHRFSHINENWIATRSGTRKEKAKWVESYRVYSGQKRSDTETFNVDDELGKPIPELIPLATDMRLIVNIGFCDAVSPLLDEIPDVQGCVEKLMAVLRDAVFKRDNPDELKWRSPREFCARVWLACVKEARCIQKLVRDNKAMISGGYTAPGYEGLSLSSKTALQLANHPPVNRIQQFKGLTKPEAKLTAIKLIKEVKEHAFFNVIQGFNLVVVLAISSILKRATKAAHTAKKGKGPEPTLDTTGVMTRSAIGDSLENTLSFTPDVLLQIVHPGEFRSREERREWKDRLFDSLKFCATHSVIHEDQTSGEISFDNLFGLTFNPNETLDNIWGSGKDTVWTLHHIHNNFLVPYLGPKKGQHYDTFSLKVFQDLLGDNRFSVPLRKATVKVMGIVLAEMQSYINHYRGLEREKDGVIDITDALMMPPKPLEIPISLFGEFTRRWEDKVLVLTLVRQQLINMGYKVELTSEPREKSYFIVDDIIRVHNKSEAAARKK